MNAHEESRDSIQYLRTRLRKIYHDKATTKNRSRRTPGEQLKKLRSFNKKTRIAIPEDIQRWLCLYDECIAWSFSLWGFYLRVMDKTDEPKKWRHSRVSCALLAGRLVQDLLAVRDLITAGFGGAAKTVARSASETIDLLSLMHLDPIASKNFRSVTNESQANAFWHSYCSKAKIDKALQKRRQELIDDDDVRDVLESWRTMYSSLIAMSSHPSMPSVLGPILDSNPLMSGDQNVLHGALGQVSHMSRFTIHFLLLRLHEFAKLFVSDYFSEKSELFDWTVVSDDFSKVYVRDAVPVLSWMVVMTSIGENDELFFPEFDTYWRPVMSFE